MIRIEQGLDDRRKAARSIFQGRLAPEQADAITWQAIEDIEAANADVLRILNRRDAASASMGAYVKR